MAFISVTVSPSSVDVNVDPNKTKVMLHEKVNFLNLFSNFFFFLNKYKVGVSRKMAIPQIKFVKIS